MQFKKIKTSNYGRTLIPTNLHQENFQYGFSGAFADFLTVKHTFHFDKFFGIIRHK